MAEQPDRPRGGIRLADILRDSLRANLGPEFPVVSEPWGGDFQAGPTVVLDGPVAMGVDPAAPGEDQARIVEFPNLINSVTGEPVRLSPNSGLRMGDTVEIQLGPNTPPVRMRVSESLHDSITLELVDDKTGEIKTVIRNLAPEWDFRKRRIKVKR